MSKIIKSIAIILNFAILFSFCACSYVKPPVISDPNNEIITENIETENIIAENILSETITSEIYLEELTEAENIITELLLEEKTINEVLTCKIIYIPQKNIEEFCKSSQIEKLFGSNVKLKSVLTKVSVGTGIILTVVVLKKAGFSDPIVSIIAGAAKGVIKGAGIGAGMGSLLGALTGAADKIDETGRTSAVICFATATLGLILSIIFATKITGVMLAFAGISILSAAAGTAHAGYNAIKKFISTDAENIDWDKINWEKVGVSAAENAIEGCADGYMWGAVAGAVYGGLEGYEFFHKFHTPYTKYNDRLTHTPTESSDKGTWSGKRGESDFVLKDPVVLDDGTKIYKITYKNAVPDFSPYTKSGSKNPENDK